MDYQDFSFADAEPIHMHRFILPRLMELCGPLTKTTRVLDIGCGNGYIAGQFAAQGCQVVGIDLGQKGIEIARKTYPGTRFEIMAADSHVLKNLDEEPFDLVISTELIEHLYAPKAFVNGAYIALKEGGRFVCSTPYHGYLKNLALSLFNKWDTHADPLWDGGHIKLWSRHTLNRLLSETGFENLQFRGAGRLPWLWMTMLISGDKPISRS